MNALIAAFRNSLRGLNFAARTERAVQQELVALILAIPAALLLSDNVWVYVSLIGVILLALAVELLNTAIEKLCDHVTPHHDLTIGLIKDMGSAAVLCALGLAWLIWTTALLLAVTRLFSA